MNPTDPLTFRSLGLRFDAAGPVLAADSVEKGLMARIRRQELRCVRAGRAATGWSGRGLGAAVATAAAVLGLVAAGFA